MKDAVALLFAKIAEWLGYPKTQLKELYAPLDLLIRDAISLLELYPEIMLAPEVTDRPSEYKLKKARDQAEQVMDKVHALNLKMEELLRSKWDLVDRDDIELFYSFLESQLRLRHASKAVLALEPENLFDEQVARRVHAKADAKRSWPFSWFISKTPYPLHHRFSTVMVSDPRPPVIVSAESA